jgi:hypothetical protein
MIKDQATAIMQMARELEDTGRLSILTHTIIAGALFDFMGYLTSRTKRIVLSASDEVTPAVDAIRDFAKKRGLSLDDALVREWIDELSTAPTALRRLAAAVEGEAPVVRTPLTNEKVWMLATQSTIGGDLHIDKFARAIEAAHGIGEKP